jgi:hypothetical protein
VTAAPIPSRTAKFGAWLTSALLGCGLIEIGLVAMGRTIPLPHGSPWTDGLVLLGIVLNSVAGLAVTVALLRLLLVPESRTLRSLCLLGVGLIGAAPALYAMFSEIARRLTGS